jgi:hypothetical protein
MGTNVKPSQFHSLLRICLAYSFSSQKPGLIVCGRDRGRGSLRDFRRLHGQTPARIVPALRAGGRLAVRCVTGGENHYRDWPLEATNHSAPSALSEILQLRFRMTGEGLTGSHPDRLCSLPTVSPGRVPEGRGCRSQTVGEGCGLLLRLARCGGGRGCGEDFELDGHGVAARVAAIHAPDRRGVGVVASDRDPDMA